MTGEEDRARGTRLREARSERFESAADAARALGVSKDTYVQHENGTRGFKRVAERYALFFRVRLEWLWTGRGEMRSAKGEPREMSEFDVAEAFGRAPAGVQRIIERILTDAGSMTEEEKRSLAGPEPRYTQEEAPRSGVQDRPKRLRGGPGDEPGIDLEAIGEALKRLPKQKLRRR